MEMQIAAWFAAGLVFVSFFMKTIVPLRRMAIASNIAFISYALMGIHFGIFAKVLPILVLHIALLPVNLMRLREIHNNILSVRNMTREHASLDALIPYMQHTSIKRGQWLFKKGDLAEMLLCPLQSKVQVCLGLTKARDCNPSTAVGRFKKFHWGNKTENLYWPQRTIVWPFAPRQIMRTAFRGGNGQQI